MKPRAATTLTLPSDREIVITRVFHAPRRLVFEAWTKPEHVRRWYGPGELTFVSCEIDLKVGGKWRYVLRDGDGNEFGFGGTYQEIARPERLIYTEGFEGMPGRESVVTITFTEQDGETTLTSTSLYPSVEDRDAHIESGMEPGMRETLNRLEDHLLTMK